MDRVKDPADPRRCTGAAPEGQCLNVAEPGCDRCRVHGGRDKEAVEDKRLCLLTKAQRRMRLAQLSEHEQIKSLRDEIALAGMLIEERFNKVKNDSDLISAFGPINMALLTVERLVKSAHTIEQNLGALLSKPTVLAGTARLGARAERRPTALVAVGGVGLARRGRRSGQQVERDLLPVGQEVGPKSVSSPFSSTTHLFDNASLRQHISSQRGA